VGSFSAKECIGKMSAIAENAIRRVHPGNEYAVDRAVLCQLAKDCICSYVLRRILRIGIEIAVENGDGNAQRWSPSNTFTVGTRKQISEGLHGG
jgi:hypothetical protein